MSNPSGRPPRPPHLGPVQPEPAERAPGPAQASIGSARMRPDGTLELRLSAEAPGGIRGEAFFTVGPGDPRYPGLVDHLGGIEPGGHAAVPPMRSGLL